MDHKRANDSYAVERYILREMAGEEREEFEEHFFSCRFCGQDVYSASLFTENARALFRDQSAPGGKGLRLLKEWMAGLHLPVALVGLAGLVLAAVLVYQNVVVIPRLRAPRSAAPVILEGETRESLLPKAPAGKPLHLQMELPRPLESDLVEVDVLNAAGTVLRNGLVDAPREDEPLDVFFSDSLKPGRYTLVVRSGPGIHEREELTRSGFLVK
jgi:hypothetical protein